MTTGDVICPVCGAVNRSLNLEETDGWMECISCGAVVQVIHLEKTVILFMPRINVMFFFRCRESDGFRRKIPG